MPLKQIADLMCDKFKLLEDNKKVINISRGLSGFNFELANNGLDIIGLRGDEVEVDLRSLFFQLESFSLQYNVVGANSTMSYYDREKIVKDHFGENKFQFGICIEAANHIEPYYFDCFPSLFSLLEVKHVWWTSAIETGESPFSWERAFGEYGFVVDWELTYEVKKQVLSMPKVNSFFHRSNLIIFKNIKKEKKQ